LAGQGQTQNVSVFPLSPAIDRSNVRESTMTAADQQIHNFICNAMLLIVSLIDHHIPLTIKL
jgi:hypothetical protein